VTSENREQSPVVDAGGDPAFASGARADGRAMTTPLPLVSVVIPIRNEREFIADLIASVHAQDYPSDRIEVIVADGMSSDGSREVLTSLQKADPRLIVVDNPQRIVSYGLNAAIARARGEVVIRIDGHTVVESDFIRQNVALLHEHPEAWSVGGPIRHIGRTTFGDAAALAMSHPLGVGNALHRYPDYEGYAEGTAFPAIRRWVFDRIGLFDERLVRNQDDEFNYRINRAGGRVYVSPRVRYRYFVRSRVKQLFRQYFQYGFWRIPVMRKHGRPTTLRQVVPTIFFTVCVIFALVGFLSRSPVIALALPVMYAVALCLVAARVATKERLGIAIRVPLAMFAMHAGYGIGMGYGLWALLLKKKAWDRRGRMATISR
jgi:GT2 family glycosyltransferase